MKLKKNKNYIILNISWVVSRLQLWRKRKENGIIRILPIFSVINPPRFLQGWIALFNKSIYLTILLMKYRLAYDRGVVCMHECPVFRLPTEQSLPCRLYPCKVIVFMVDPIVEHDKRNPREKLHTWYITNSMKSFVAIVHTLLYVYTHYYIHTLLFTRNTRCNYCIIYLIC